MDWRLIFQQSRANGGPYLGEQLIQRVYKPVASSWFQERLHHVREEMKKELLEGLERKVSEFSPRNPKDQ
jgi:hypothetical protein